MRVSGVIKVDEAWEAVPLVVVVRGRDIVPSRVHIAGFDGLYRSAGTVKRVSYLVAAVAKLGLSGASSALLLCDTTSEPMREPPAALASFA